MKIRMSTYTPAYLFAKITDIGLVSSYYLVFGLSIAFVIDVIMGPFKKEEYEKKHTGIILGEILLHFFVIGVIVYILRNIIERIPSPVEGVGGFEHRRLKEIGGGVIGTTILIGFQKHLQDKLTYVKDRFVTLKTTALSKH
jgi:hypothetical protein